MFRVLYLTGVLFIGLVLQVNGQVTDPAYALMLKGMYRNTVPLISPAELQAGMPYTRHLLLDTRSGKEYRVSHLAGASLVDYDSFDLATLKHVSKSTPIVVYCSVGYRSERIGEKLQEAGYTNVRNLYGGLFEWVNQGRDVYNARGKTDKVHAHSPIWGIWLRKGEKVYD